MNQKLLIRLEILIMDIIKVPLVSLDVLNYSSKNGIFTVDAIAKVIQNSKDINDPYLIHPHQKVKTLD